MSQRSEKIIEELTAKTLKNIDSKNNTKANKNNNSSTKKSVKLAKPENISIGTSVKENSIENTSMEKISSNNSSINGENKEVKNKVPSKKRTLHLSFNLPESSNNKTEIKSVANEIKLEEPITVPENIIEEPVDLPTTVLEKFKEMENFENDYLNEPSVFEKFNINIANKETIQPITTNAKPTINENSSFFYTPTVFEEYKIAITDTEDDNIIPYVKQPVNNSNNNNTTETIKIENNNNKVIYNEEPIGEVLSLNDIVTTDDSSIELDFSYDYNDKPIISEDKTTTIEESELLDLLSDEDLDKLTEEATSSYEEITEEIKLDDKIISNDENLNSEIDTTINNIELSADDLELLDTDNIESSLDFSNVNQKNDIITEAASSIDSTVEENKVTNMIKTSEQKVKKTFSNIKSVFKNFSFDDVDNFSTSNNYENEDDQQISNTNVSSIKNLLNTTGTSNDDNLIFDSNKNVTELNVAVDSISIPETTIASEKNISLDDISLDDLTSSDDDILINISTEKSGSNNSFLSDDEIEELLAKEDLEKETLKDGKSDFSIEDYFGITDLKNKKNNNEEDIDIEDTDKDEDEDFNEIIKEDVPQEELDNIEFDEDLNAKLSENEATSLTKLFDSFSKTISSLSTRITELETTKTNTIVNDNKNTEEVINSNVIEPTIDSIDTINTNDTNVTNVTDETDDTNITNDINLDDIDINDISLDDLDDISIQDDDLTDSANTIDPKSPISIEDLLTDALIGDDGNIDNSLKEQLLNEVLSDGMINDVDLPTSNQQNAYTDSAANDFLKIIDTLSKTINELEQSTVTPIVTSQMVTPPELSGPTDPNKAFNILINKDDIFSISILNETYEIVTDFDGIQVVSENVNISTPKKNFFIKVGNDYIEIHNYKTYFLVQSSFEDVEFANAINNVTFAKKNNRIELNIKEAFKITSVNHKLELSMLNTDVVGDIRNNAQSTSSEIEKDTSVDNKTLLISEETQKVYLPYTMEEVLEKLNDSNNGYQTINEVVENEYTLPLSTFKMPIISRFREAYRFMRTKEKSSVYAAVDLALELMFNSNLNPAVIRASKDLKELNVYLDCLYENELDKFDCFKIIYKVLPKIQ